MPNIKQIQLPNENIYDILDANALHTTDLKSTTKGTKVAADKGNTENKEYAVGYDKNGKLSVNIPWTDNNTTYSAGDGIDITNTVVTNTGVRSISTGSSNGTISVNTNGTSANVSVKGLKNSAYKDTTDTYSSTGTNPVTGKAIANAFSTIAPMIYKGTLGTGGTITDLPTASSDNKGFTYKVITSGTYDGKSAIAGDMFISDGSNWVLISSGDEPSGTVTSITAGDGLSGGTITTSGTIKANLKSYTKGTYDSTAMGSTANKQYAVGLDKSGYLSVNIPWTDTNTKVTSVGNHYAPTEDSSAELSVDASSSTSATWDDTSLVTGVNLQRDGKGHVVGVTVDSIKMPANPNTNTTYTLNVGTGDDANKIVLTSSTGAANKIVVPYATNSETVNGKTVETNVPSNAVFTDTKVTSSANHYSPTTVSGSDISVEATGASAAWSIDVVKGITLNTDGKGHVTGIEVESGKIPANPNTDTKVRQSLLTTNTNRPLLMSYALNNNTTTNVDNVTYRNNNIYANPNDGTITANGFNGDLNGDASTVNGHTVNSDVPSDAVFTDTWRPIQNNLTSDSTTDSLSAKQGKALANGSARDNTKLPLSGGTMTGVLTLKGSMYEDGYSGALNVNNSDIYGLNSIYTSDSANNSGEGIHFYRDTTHVDSLWVSGGDIMFVPNREIGTTTTKENSQKVGRFTANPTTGQVVVTDGTTGGMKSSGYTIAKSVPNNAVFTDTTYTPEKENIGSASAGTAISADDITSWSAGTMTTTSVSQGVLTITNGTKPSLSYTAKSIPNITVSSKSVVTGITAN